MVKAWQAWLSPRPQRRSVVATDSTLLAAHEAALFEFLNEDGRWIVRETHYVDNKIVRDGLSGPPLHIHWRQDEYFQVERGVLGLVRNGQQLAVTKDSGTVKIPAGSRHRFWAHATSSEDLVFKVWADPQDLDNSFDENFLHNFVGYLRDCQLANLKPSPFQLILMSYNSSTVSTPDFWVPLWLLRLVHYILAYWIAAALLGYEASYPEYTRVVEKGVKSTRKSQ